MKKIIFSLCLTALAIGCAKTEVNYGETDQIAFAPVAQMSTKAAVESGAPACDLIVSANAGAAGSAASACTELYFNNVTFTNNESGIFTANGYFWPNVKHLTFAGITMSAGVKVENVKMDVSGNVIVLANYPQQEINTENNDLMWFEHTAPAGKTSSAIAVDMKHACSWLVFNFIGDDTSADEWNITNIKINNISVKETVTLAPTGASTEAIAVWTENQDKKVNLRDLTVPVEKSAKIGTTTAPYNPSANGIIVIPQTPATLSITYNYVSQAGGANGKDIVIQETATVSLDYDGVESTNTKWEAGKKYTYTITIGTSPIKIAPTASPWVDYDSDTTTEDKDPITTETI